MDTSPVDAKKPKFRLVYVLLLALAVLGAVAFWVARQSSDNDKSPASTPVVRLKTPAVRPDLVTTGLASPTAIVSTSDSADQRLFVVQQSGLIRIINPAGHLEATPFLDIHDKIMTGGEMGLLGLAFNPDYKQNGYFYINYIDKDQNTIIARYHVSAEAAIADPASAKILFTLKQPYQNHNGGDLVFGSDKYLYAALGDGGSAGDPQNHAQDKNSFFGKILRIDVNSGDPYTVPPTNPFVGQADAKPEIWAYGLRNPWRLSFDKKTGDLYIADVGQGKLEELNIQKASSKGGENYGWRCYEGKQPYDTSSGCNPTDKYMPPVLEYDHQEDRCSITGGYVYRGNQYPALEGKYFYGDYCSGQIFYASNDAKTWSNVLAAATPYSISAFGQGSDGELYFVDYKTGSLYHIRDVAND